MSRVPKIALIAAGSVAGLVVIAAVGILIILQTSWFRQFAASKIQTQVETATGGRSAIGGFSFSPRGLRVEIGNFVLHGTEGPNEPPLFRAQSIVVGLKIFSVLRHRIDIAFLEIDAPQAYIRVARDGTTNLPHPQALRPEGNKGSIQTVLDLAIGYFDLRDGSILFADRKMPLTVRGENLRARLTYDLLGPAYSGDLSMAPVYVQTGSHPALPVDVRIPIRVESNQIVISNARLNTLSSHVEISTSLAGLAAPRGSLRLKGRLALDELARSFDPALLRKVQNLPPLDLNFSSGLNRARLEAVKLQASLGDSHLEASGPVIDLKQWSGSLRFQGGLVLAELGRTLNLSARPQGAVSISGDVKLAGANRYSVAANLSARNVAFNVGKSRLTGVNAAARIGVNPAAIYARDLYIAALGGRFTGSAQIEQLDRFRIDGNLHDFDLRYLARRYATPEFVWDGAVSGPLHAASRLRGSLARNLRASAQLAIAPRNQGVPLAGKIIVSYDGPRDVIDLRNSFVVLPSSRLDFSGSIGSHLNIRLVSRNLDDFLPALSMTSENSPRALPVTLVNGAVRASATVAGKLSDPRIAGRIELTNFAVNRRKFDRFSAEWNAAGTGAAVRNAVLRRGALLAQLSGSAGLRRWKPEPSEPIAATVAIHNAQLQDLLALASRPSLPVSGVLAAEGNVSGTLGDPRMAAAVSLTNGAAYGEPFQRIQALANYSRQLVQLTSAEALAPAGRIHFSGAFEHPPGNFRQGRVQFQIASTRIEIQKLGIVQKQEPRLTGTLELNAEGAGAFQAGSPATPFLFSSLNAKIAAHVAEVNTNRAGTLLLTAETQGQNLSFHLQSDVAGSQIRGDGSLVMRNDYPLQTKITFSPVDIAALARLLSKAGPSANQTFSGTLEGAASVTGPVLRPENIKGRLEITKLQVNALTPAAPGAAGGASPLAFHNPSPIVATLDRSVVHVESAKLTGPSTDFSVAGAVYLNKQKALDLRASGNIDLRLAQTFSPSIFSSGNIQVEAAVQGTVSQPALNGRLQLQKASFNMVDVPNGISNANGLILFNGSEAVIQTLTGETGGGKVSFGGTIRYGGPEMAFNLQARAQQIRVLYPSNVSTQLSANLTLNGTTTDNLLSGNVIVQDVAFYSHTDVGRILSGAAAPPRAPAAQTGVLGGMRFDVRIDTSSAFQLQTALTQNVQAEAHLQLRGSPSSPGMLGRIDAQQGEVIFFGSKYEITAGTISFFNPSNIEPVLDFALETQAQGVTVDIMVRGPMDKLTMTYRSDPPMQFSDIVSLLATGRVPSTDPVLAAQQPAAPQQSMQQFGASAVLSQAVANPVSGRLQRLFGVTKLKIDPQIVGPENTPQARLTLEQQITKDLDFTYITDLTQGNQQIVRIEWAIDPTWSAVAVRQQDGQFGVDIYYKKRFR